MISTLIPNYGPGGPIGSTPNIVILKGANLDTTVGVRIGDKKASFIILDSETLQLVMPTGFPATQDYRIPTDVQLYTAGGNVTKLKAYTYVG